MLNWLAIIWVFIALIAIGFIVLMLGSLAGIAIELFMTYLELRKERASKKDE